MKTLLSFTTMTLCMHLIFAQSSTNPVEYMDYFSNSYKQIQQDMWDYTRTISHGKNARKVEKRRMELISTSDQALEKAKGAGKFNGSGAYRDSVVSYFQIINHVLREDYAKLVDMEEVAEQSYDLMEAYMMARDLASEKQSEAADMVNAEQKKFADENKVTLIESSSELGKKMEIAGEVYTHYSAVYLIFFKSNKQEMYLMDAITKKDINAIEQNRTALQSTVEEGKEKLKSVVLYKEDPRMVDATKAIFDFYLEEAKGMDIVLDYYLKAENFQKVKTAFDAKKEKDRTKEDVDNYNNAVNEMNAAVNTYNAQNARFNELRSKLIDSWNKNSQSFTDTHVPSGK